MKKLLVAMAMVLALTLVAGDTVKAQSLPPLPDLYSGTVTVDGKIASGQVWAEVGLYASRTVAVNNGNYALLIVGPTFQGAPGSTIDFYFIGTSTNKLRATETANYAVAANVKGFQLTFAGSVTPAPTPTAGPTQVPTPGLGSGIDALEDRLDQDSRDLVATIDLLLEVLRDRVADLLSLRQLLTSFP